MAASENKKLLQDIFAELAKSNARPFVHAMADDFRWTLSGDGTWGRTYQGKRAVVDELFATLAKHMDRITTVPDRFIADGDYVAVEAHGSNTTKNGKPYNNRYCFVFRVANGKLAELTEYMDTELAANVLGPP